MARSFRAALPALAVVAAGALAGCSGDGGTPSGSPTSIAAFPDVPRVGGPLPVLLQPALPLVSDASCATPAGEGVRCLDGQSFRALGDERDATVAAVRTRPNADHTSWEVDIRFAPRSRADLRTATTQAAGMGGMLLVEAATGDVLAAVPPADASAGRARFLGLEKSEAWGLVEAFSRSTTGM